MAMSNIHNRSPEWELVAEAVRHRDNRECQRCGMSHTDHPTKLHVHHIRPASELSEEVLHDESNLITLCRNCHRELDSKAMTVEKQLDELGYNSTDDIPSLARLPGELREIDRVLLELLKEERVTPAYARARLIEDNVEEYSRGYVQQRLARLEEHGHTENLLETGLYQLTNDPRNDTEQDEKRE